MADKKISQLTGATTPLAGTEVLPVVQSGSTVKVSVANLTAGRDVTAANLNLTGLAAASGFSASGSATPASGQSVEVTWFGNDGYITTYDRTNSLYRNLNIRASITTFSAEGTEYWRLKTDGNLAVSVAGKGIDFSANTHAAGMTSELLNWYEEGAWTPTIAASTGTITSYTSTGTYTRVGRQVTLLGSCTITDAGTGAGFLSISGLPFNIADALASGCGREVALTGDALAANYASATAIDLNIYNNANMPVTGRVFSFVLTYFA